MIHIWTADNSLRWSLLTLIVTVKEKVRITSDSFQNRFILKRENISLIELKITINVVNFDWL